MTASKQTNARRKVQQRSKLCPSCGSDQVLPIQYGFPPDELMEESRQGRVILGGCCISDESPEWHCASCDHEWGRLFSDQTEAPAD